MSRRSYLPEASDLLAASPDLEARFVAEIRARRERLEQWVRLIEAEFRRERAARRRLHRCRGGSQRRTRAS